MPRTHELLQAQRIEKPIDEVFPFFADASNLELITPKFLRFRIATSPPITMRAGTRIDYQLSLFGVPLRWRTRIVEFERGRRFIDEQEAGPYALWRHAHEFEGLGRATLVRDRVEYREPFGALGGLAHALFVERTLNRIFDFRRDAIARYFEPPRGPLGPRVAGPTP